MTILLINDNPVVSRLLSLCTRDDEILLEKVSDIDDASSGRYDALFVDEASCEGDVASLSTRLDVGKKIYLSYSDDPMAGFDATIKKPFLPSQIIDILQTIEVREPLDEVVMEETPIDIEDVEENTSMEEVPSIFPLSSEEIEEKEQVTEEEVEEDVKPKVLDRGELDKIKALLDMDEEEPEEFDLNEEDYESRKREVITEQLIADGLDILKEEEIVDELSKAEELEKRSGKEKSKIKQNNKTKEKKIKKTKKNDKFSKDEWFAVKKAVEDAIKILKPKKIKKLLKGEEIKIPIKLEDKN